jgi:iron complex outermembrane receptor protein
MASSAMLMTVLFGATTALAQEVTGNIEEVVVTAQKRSENVQDVPKTVQVISQEVMTRANVARLADLSKLSPSLDAQDTTRGSASLVVRGISSFQNSYGLVNKVGIVIDDVPQHSNATLSNELADIERVEILPGPQSTLTGRNSTAGLINIVTRSPAQVFGGNAGLTYTNDGERRLNLFVTGPLSDTAAASLSAYDVDFRGLQKNVGTGEYAGREVRGLRGKLLWQPNERFSALLTGYFQDSRLDNPGPAYTFIQPGTYNGVDTTRSVPFASLFPGLNINPDNVDFYNPPGLNSRAEEWGGILRLDYDLSVLTLSSISSFYRLSHAGLSSTRHVVDVARFTGTPLVTTTAGVFKDGVRSDIQEFRLTSNGDGRLTYLAGLIYDSSVHDLFLNRRSAAGRMTIGPTAPRASRSTEQAPTSCCRT